jgi:hypothetical protein
MHTNIALLIAHVCQLLVNERQVTMSRFVLILTTTRLVTELLADKNIRSNRWKYVDGNYQCRSFMSIDDIDND